MLELKCDFLERIRVISWELPVHMNIVKHITVP
jgi:hypothetical protein